MTLHRNPRRTDLLTVLALVLTLGLTAPLFASQESVQAAEGEKGEKAATASNSAADSKVAPADAKAAAAAREAARAAACASPARANAPVNTLEDMVAHWNAVQADTNADARVDPRSAAADREVKPVVWRAVKRPARP